MNGKTEATDWKAKALARQIGVTNWNRRKPAVIVEKRNTVSASISTSAAQIRKAFKRLAKTFDEVSKLEVRE